MIFNASDHTFTVCAYKESEYLEECIKSLLAQSVQTNIIIATSTPNDYIKGIAEKYNLPLYENDSPKGIGGDWNFAYSNAKTPLVTIAHQDDIYEPDYAKEMLEHVNQSQNPIIYFCHYAELRNGKKVYENKLLNIKRLLLSPLKPKFAKKSRFIRRRVLSLGCAICCPSVTLVKPVVGENPFTNDFLSNIDWQQWEMLSRKKGSFVYNPNQLMCHRVHEESATSEIIGNGARTREDYTMFCKFWPRFIAKLLEKQYSKSEKSNNI